MSRATSIAERLRDPDNLVVRYEAIDELERLDLINKELIEALEAVLNMSCFAERNAAFDQARAAIAKARGTDV